MSREGSILAHVPFWDTPMGHSIENWIFSIIVYYRVQFGTFPVILSIFIVNTFKKFYKNKF